MSLEQEYIEYFPRTYLTTFFIFMYISRIYERKTFQNKNI